MIINSLLLFVVILVVSPSNSLNTRGDECVQDGPCTCKYPNTFEINLKNLTNEWFNSSSNYFAYFYLPCYDLPINISKPLETSALWFFHAASDNGTPLDPELVLKGEVNGTFLPLATVASGKFELTQFNANNAKIEYILNGTKTSVELDCADNLPPSLLILPDTFYSNHRLLLRGDIACAKMLVAPISHVLSTGSVLVIMLLTFIIIYLVGGMLLLKWIRGAEGLEMIPNIEFWQDLPYLVRDGIKFAVSCGKVSDSYERI